MYKVYCSKLKKKCTWKSCNKEAEYPQLDKNKDEWANLCKKHHDMLESSIEDLVTNSTKENIKKQLSYWIKASGGAEVMAKSILNKKGGQLDV